MKRNPVSVVTLLMIVALGGVPTSAQKKRLTPEETIRAADQQWLKVFAARDLEKSAGFCTDDGSVLAPMLRLQPAMTKSRSCFQASSHFPISR
jgi:hypothetical protein